jgi:8-amino-7-oxononanoate synthase
VREADHLRKRLHSVVDAFRKRLKTLELNIGNSASQIIPVFLGSNDRALQVAARLNRAGFAVRAIRPPTVPPGTARLRLSLNATLSLEHLDRLADELQEAAQESEVRNQSAAIRNMRAAIRDQTITDR